MVKIIPSINAETWDEVIQKIRRVEPFVEWCHLDVTDGVFSKHPTWHSPEDLPNLKTKLNVEVHLMVSNPDGVIDDWLVSPVRRVIVHAEAVKDFPLMLEKSRDGDVELGIAINPETEWEVMRPYIGKASLLQTLAVHPGPSGQGFSGGVFEKIRHIRKSCPPCIIEVDGGITLEIAHQCIKAGANILVAGSYIFNHADLETAFKSLMAVK